MTSPSARRSPHASSEQSWHHPIGPAPRCSSSTTSTGVVRPRAAPAGCASRRRPSRDHRASRPAGRLRLHRLSGPLRRDLAVRQAELRLARRARPHQPAQVRRDQVEPAGHDVSGRQRRGHARVLHLQPDGRRSSTRRPLQAPLNPFVGPLPQTSGSPGFHPIATGVPARHPSARPVPRESTSAP